ncbi:ATP-binding protein [Anoxybacillus gonensis]
MILLLLFVLLWIGGAIVLLIDHKNSASKWASVIAFVGGFGGLSVVIEENMMPYSASSTVVKLIVDLLSFICHYVTPYAFLMFSITYSGLFSLIYQKRLTYILLTPILFMAIKYPIYPISVPYHIALWWVAPYIVFGICLLLLSYIKETHPILKRNRFFTNLIFIPPISFALITNYILRAFGDHDSWRYNTDMIIISFSFFIVSLFKYGILHIRLNIHRLYWKQSMQSIFIGTAMLNHKLKNDISKLQLFCRRMEQYANEQHDNELLSNIQNIQEVVQHLQATLSKFQSKITFRSSEKKRENMEEVMEESISSIRHMLNQIQIETNYDSTIILYCDKQQFKEVFVNMILNAIEAMPNGGTIKVHFQESFRYHIIQISDTGTGIDKQTLPHIFEPFFTTKRAKSKNYGIGLTYCCYVVQQHGGFIEVESEKCGTTFSLKFPKYSFLK